METNKKEAKEREEQEKEQKQNMPKMPSMSQLQSKYNPSNFKMPTINMPKF